MCVVNKGRLNGCNNNIGGVKELYLYSYNNPSYTDNVVINNTLIKTIDGTMIYGYGTTECVFNEDVEINEDGELYNQTITTTLPFFDYEVMSYTGKLVIAIIRDFQDRYRVVGLENGAEIEVSATSGGAYTDRNGLEIEIKGEELMTAPFINNLSGVGYVVGDNLLQETGDYLLLENGFKIRI